MVKEVLSHLEDSTVDLFVSLQLLEVALGYAGEDHLGQDCENAIIVVLANGKVHVVACDHVVVQLTDDLDVLPLFLVDIRLDLLLLETVPQLEQLNHILRRLFEDDQAINGPGVETQSVVPVEDQLGQELEDT